MANLIDSNITKKIRLIGKCSIGLINEIPEYRPKK